MYTDNNPLTYILTTAKLDAASHCWVAILANYNFWLYYQAGKTNMDADTLLRMSWPAAGVQGAALKGPTSPIEAYSCDLHILDAVQASQQVACMILED